MIASLSSSNSSCSYAESRHQPLEANPVARDELKKSASSWTPWRTKPIGPLAAAFDALHTCAWVGGAAGCLAVELPSRMAARALLGGDRPVPGLGPVRTAAHALGRAAGALGGVVGTIVGAVVGLPLAAWVGVQIGLGHFHAEWRAVPTSDALRASRRTAQRQYSQDLSWQERWTLRLRSAAHYFHSSAEIFSHLLHPQIGEPRPVSMSHLPKRERRLPGSLTDMDDTGRQQWAKWDGTGADVERLDIVTKDHVHLDAALVKAPPECKNPVTLVVFGANCERFEEGEVVRATQWSARGVQTLLWNGRGIGESTGREYSTRDEICDGEAVLQYAAKNFRNLHAYGRSLGGTVLVTSLGRLVDRGELTSDTFTTAMADHSFSSLSSVAHGVSSQVTSLLRQPIIDYAIASLGMDPLDAAGTLERTRIARDVILTSADEDEVIAESARLDRAPASANVVTGIISENAGHNYFEGPECLLDYWAPEAESSDDEELSSSSSAA